MRVRVIRYSSIPECRIDARCSRCPEGSQGLTSSPAIRKAIATIPDDAWVAIPYFLDGADVAETTYWPFGKDQPEVRLIVRRVRPTPGSQLALFVEYSHHGFITDRAGDTLVLEADHRRHAVVEDVIRDLKYGVGLNHLPSGRFGANAAWLATNVMAHNLARWVSRLGLGETLIATDTLRRRHLRVPGRVTRSGRKVTLHRHRRQPAVLPNAHAAPFEL